MSAETTPVGLDPRDEVPTCDETLAAVADLLASTAAEMSAVLDDRPGPHAIGDDTHPAAASDLDVDLAAELRRRLGGGKRIRPRLAHWGWVLGGGASGGDGTWPGLVRVAAALELLHLFGLVHDDVMDRSDTRRGIPTLHVDAADRHRAAGGLGDPVLFGDSVAILLGDLALSESASLVGGCSPEVRRAWRLMTVELVGGQLLDVVHTAGRQRDLATARRIARAKSGRYTVTRPLELGALVAGADARTVERVVAWGDLVGDAFAVRDDVLGVWGDPEVTGKPAGDDLLGGKPTVLLVWAGDLLPDSARPLLAACDAGTLDADGARALRDAMDGAGIRARAEDEVRRLADRAHALVDELTTDPSAAEALRAVVRSVAWRSS